MLTRPARLEKRDFGTKPRRAVFQPLCVWGNGAENRNFPKSAQNPGRGTTKEGRSRMAGLARAKWANGACWRIRPLWGLHVHFTPRGLPSANHVKISRRHAGTQAHASVSMQRGNVRAHGRGAEMASRSPARICLLDLR